MKQSIDAGQQRIACWINKEGRDEMNLAPMSLSRVARRLMWDLTGHTRSSADRATFHPAAREFCPNVHWSPAKVDTKARPRYENWLGWCPTGSKYWRKNSASSPDPPGMELG